MFGYKPKIIMNPNALIKAVMNVTHPNGKTDQTIIYLQVSNIAAFSKDSNNQISIILKKDIKESLPQNAHIFLNGFNSNLLTDILNP